MAGKKKLSFFELVATLAFEYFARQQVEVAVIETGLGGRLDATNVLSPVMTIITNISIDHAEILGPTLADIAAEKAGIIKPGIPTVMGQIGPEARQVIRRTCAQRKAPLVTLRKNEYSICKTDQSLSFGKGSNRLTNLKPALKGAHQLHNAALVLKAVMVLQEQGFKISKAQARTGLESTSWPGRFQIMRPDPKSSTVVLDVCHNENGARAFVETFEATFPGRKAQMIVGFVQRKAHQEIIDLMARVASRFWLVSLGTKRTVDTADLARELDWHGVPVVRRSRLTTAWSAAVRQASANDIIAIIGSHFLVGEYLERFGKH